MINYTWKIVEVLSENNQLKQIKYNVEATKEDKFVETEGYASFELPEEVSFIDITERELLSYLKRFYIQGDVNLIEFRLAEQLDYLSKNISTKAPWHIDTFTIEQE